MQIEEILKLVETTLDDRKGEKITTIDVQGRTTIADFLVIATGTSSRHVKSLCDYVVKEMKQRGKRPLGVEGEQGSDWVLVDLGDVILHVMTAQARELYQLEKLWDTDLFDDVTQ